MIELLEIISEVLPWITQNGKGLFALFLGNLTAIVLAAKLILIIKKSFANILENKAEKKRELVRERYDVQEMSAYMIEVENLRNAVKTQKDDIKYFRYGWEEKNEAYGILENELESLRNQLLSIVVILETTTLEKDSYRLANHVSLVQTQIKNCINQIEEVLQNVRDKY